MQDFIAALLAVLGTLLVLAGAAVTVLKAPTPATPAVPGDPEPATSRLRRVASGLNGADRLIAWGVVLLVLAAVAAGAISFNFGATAGSR
jgi:hypothetical protein